MNDIGVIHLTNGGFTVVDAEDFEKANRFNWHSERGYVRRRPFCNGKQIVVYLHRFLTNAQHGQSVDHKNWYPIDNRKSNLRLANQSLNSAHSRIQKRSNKSSQFKGVCWSKQKKKWEAYIKVCRKMIHLGRFRDEVDAATAYNTAAIKFFGEFANPNPV